MRLLVTLLLAATLGISGLQAQQPGPSDGFECLANDPVELQRHLDATPGALQQAQAAKALLDAHTQAMAGASAQRQVYQITVVVHVIHNNGPENISDAQVYDAIRILNEDFNKENPDWTSVQPAFLDLVGDVGIEFLLAKRDPWGNCTNGITRTESTQTYDGDFEMTQLIQWPRDRYMNIWVAASANGAAGYTYYPEWLDGWPEADGMVVKHDYVGSIGTSSPSRSRVISHEVGHWLNLKHCWGDSNEPGLEENCWMDDEVDDTPLTKGWSSCWLQASSCGSSQDNVENYMEYSYCDKMFTHGQADRMIAALTSPIAQRDQLWQQTTLAVNGLLEEPQLCVADFTHGATEICAGGAVAFSDISYHGVSGRAWSFPGGEPSTSTEEAPMITYPVPGSYPVTLQVSDGTNTQTITRDALVNVLPATGREVPWSEDFELPDALAAADWVVRNPDADATWEPTDLAAYTGSQCLRLVNGPTTAGRRDDLVSSTFDMSDATEINISFRYAFARRNEGNDDRLRLYVSSDCGATWSMRLQLRGSNTLNTAGGFVFGNFVPNGTGQWRDALVNNISANYHSPDFRVRFEFESYGGNNVYLDDININGMPVGLEEMSTGTSVMRVMPNPASDVAWVEFDMADAGRARLELVDQLGRSIRVFRDGPLGAGPHRLSLPLDGLASGSYIISLRKGGALRVQRLTIH